MSLRILIDTSIYVDYFRAGMWSEIVEPAAEGFDVSMSVVVLHELLIGARSRKSLEAVEVLEGYFRSAKRLDVPIDADWSWASFAIRDAAQARGFEDIGRARLTNDALIASSAARLGAVLVTRNARDFHLLEVERRGVEVFDPSAPR